MALRKNDPDQNLVLEAQQGDQDTRVEAFGQLYDKYRAQVERVCRQYSRNPHDVSDAAQETFVTLYRKLDGFRFEGTISSWINRIASNASIDIKRATRSRPWKAFGDLRESADRDDHKATFQDESADAPFESPALQELQTDVRKAIAGLSEKLREVVILRYFENLPYDDIAARLNISLGTVKSRLFRAHEALEHWLAPTLHRHVA